MTKYLPLLLLVFVTASCVEEKEIFESAPLMDYVALSPGKFITYRLDSTVFERSGTVVAVHKYQVKHRVVQETAGENGARIFLVQRTINNENGTDSWINNGNYYVTVSDKKVEVTDNNLHIVVLQAPLSKGFNWKGNSRLALYPYTPLFDMAAGMEMNKWNFAYTGFGSETFAEQQYNDVWTIEQHNEILNIPPTPDTKIGTKEVSVEKYAKGIGLVYKDLQIYEYQGAGSSNNPDAHYTGFGITMWIVDHN